MTSLAYQTGLHAYTHEALEQDVLSASPHRLIVLLFDGALCAINRAAGAIDAGMIREKGEAISKAISIVEQGLRASLDHEGGGELVENMSKLYRYIEHLLLQANVNNDIAPLDEARRLLNELCDAWMTVKDSVRATTTVAS